LAKENGISNAPSGDGGENREERRCVLILNGIAEDAEETEARSFKDQTQSSANKK
jgi:hypothetical protein